MDDQIQPSRTEQEAALITWLKDESDESLQEIERRISRLQEQQAHQEIR
jgi:hypothetical protein